jgi:hypothetical protein
MIATPSVRHLQKLEELINRVVREAELMGRILLASIVGRTVGDVARAADHIVVNFRGGATLTMNLQSLAPHANEPLELSARLVVAGRSCSAN